MSAPASGPLPQAILPGMKNTVSKTGERRFYCHQKPTHSRDRGNSFSTFGAAYAHS